MQTVLLLLFKETGYLKFDCLCVSTCSVQIVLLLLLVQCQRNGLFKVWCVYPLSALFCSCLFITSKSKFDCLCVSTHYYMEVHILLADKFVSVVNLSTR